MTAVLAPDDEAHTRRCGAAERHRPSRRFTDGTGRALCTCRETAIDLAVKWEMLACASGSGGHVDQRLSLDGFRRVSPLS
jgi:hypothetical protein